MLERRVHLWNHEERRWKGKGKPVERTRRGGKKDKERRWKGQGKAVEMTRKGDGEVKKGRESSVAITAASRRR